MKHTITVLLTLLVIASVHAQGTFIHRVDMTRNNNPYYTGAIILDSGWEFWGFGYDNQATQDWEIGRLYPVGGNWYIGGYAAYWPDSKKWFALPWVTYYDSLANGQLNINLCTYIPLNGGPRILFSDGSTLVWQDKRGNDFGLVASYWRFGNAPATLRIGPTIGLSLGKTKLRINYEPLHILGSGPSVLRIETTFRF